MKQRAREVHSGEYPPLAVLFGMQPRTHTLGKRRRASETLSSQEGACMRTRAAVALEAGKPLEIMEVELEGPKAGEVLVEIKATGLCHTDEFTRSGADPEGLFPCILGHEQTL